MSRLALLFLLLTFPFTFAQSEKPEIMLSEGKFLGLGTANAMAFSPDGKFVATAGSLGVVLWDSQTFEVLRVLEGPDYIYEGGDEPDFSAVSVKDLTTGEVAISIPHELYIHEIGFDATGRYVYSHGYDGVLFFDLQAKHYVGKFRDTQRNPLEVTGIILLPDAKYFAVTLTDGNLKFFRTNDLGYLCCEVGQIHDEQFTHHWDLTLSPDGKKLVSRAPDGLIKLWNIEITDSTNE
jgi:WD40 repeat protein